MKVKDLNGRISHWKTTGCHTQNDNKSSLHLKAREKIIRIFPNIIILEEVPIRIYAHKILFLDFYLPIYKKAIEVHGKQHFVFNPHFFPSRFEFKKQQLNDALKKEWCAANEIIYIELKFDEEDQWTTQIKG